MEEVQNLIKMCLDEIERMLTTKTVVGEPMTIEGNTIIPLVNIGFGFGGGSGTGKGPKETGEGTGTGTGGAGSVKPVAVIVVNKEGVRIESVKGGAATFAEKVADVAGKVMEGRAEAKKAAKKEG